MSLLPPGCDAILIINPDAVAASLGSLKQLETAIIPRIRGDVAFLGRTHEPHGQRIRRQSSF